MQRYYSRIYWHFTGGQQRPEHVAYKHLKEILNTRTLKATSTERLTSHVATGSFCCVTDIPFKDLIYHAENYGRFAIGFRPEAIHYQFLPVFYIHNQHPLWLNPEAEAEIDDAPSQERATINETRIEAELMQIPPSIRNYLKITEFAPDNENFFYREREWRLDKDFVFSPDHISAVIAPEHRLPEVRDYLFRELGYDPKISVLAWELLEQV
jgi:hypothetical protein